jgi:hypothetical protein
MLFLCVKSTCCTVDTGVCVCERAQGMCATAAAAELQQSQENMQKCPIALLLLAGYRGDTPAAVQIRRCV